MPKLLVLGSSNTDMTVHLPRLPAPGETCLGGAFLCGPGGKGANQAVAAARAGADVVFVTAVGDDAFGLDALDLYRRERIDVSHARTLSGTASGVALIFVADDGENMIAVASGANSRLGPEDIDQLAETLFAPDRLLLIAGLEIPVPAVARAVRRAASAGMRVLLNPAPASASLLEAETLDKIDVITPNRLELEALTGLTVLDQPSLKTAAQALCELGPRRVVVTLGALGSLIYERGEFQKIPSHTVAAVDTVGAGDAFNGALAVALAEGKELADAADWASAAAALAVTQRGAQSALARREEIDRLASRR